MHQGFVAFSEPSHPGELGVAVLVAHALLVFGGRQVLTRPLARVAPVERVGQPGAAWSIALRLTCRPVEGVMCRLTGLPVSRKWRSLDGETVTLDKAGAGNVEAVLQGLLDERLVGLKLGGHFA